MKSGRHPHQETPAAETYTAIVAPHRFTIKGPREARALHELLRRPAPREVLDRVAGCSNGPALVAELRERGLTLPCVRTPTFDRDGKEVRRGVYSLTSADKRAAYRAFAALRRERAR
jgi:hypothetical protein